MPRKRLLNCEFVDDSRFKLKLTNRAKLLYFTMFAAADDKGFVGNTLEIISTLEGNESETLGLVQGTYKDALKELIDKGFIYSFEDNHDNTIHLIRHWYCHNKYFDKAWTNYGKYLKKVKLVSGEYVLKKGNEQVEEPVEEEPSEDDWDKMVNELERQNTEKETIFKENK